MSLNVLKMSLLDVALKLQRVEPVAMMSSSYLIVSPEESLTVLLVESTASRRPCTTFPVCLNSLLYGMSEVALASVSERWVD